MQMNSRNLPAPSFCFASPSLPLVWTPPRLSFRLSVHHKIPSKMALRRPAAALKQATTPEDDVATFVVPDLSVKDLLSVIPQHCFKRSALRSFSYVVWDCFLLGAIYKGTKYAEAQLLPTIDYPHPYFETAAYYGLWSLYGYAAGLVATGIWVIAHECGHQAFSESKFINNTMGWILHSSLGVPYHSWRISHAKHHASTGHMNLDQVFVPKTRSELRLPPLDPAKDDPLGIKVSDEVMKEMWEAIGDSPFSAATYGALQLLFGWPMYLIRNATGQRSYPRFTNHFQPSSVIFAPHQRDQILLSDVGVLLWIAALVYSSMTFGFGTMMRVYGVPYLWVNSWLVLITFLQHTDPMLPHYRAAAFNFQRGALSTLDRSLLGGAGPFFGWLGGFLTHGISETHVLHHVCSKIPHYHAWEASDALRKRLASAGIHLQGAPGGWSEVVKTIRQCKFVEDEGDVVFYKNAYGNAACKAVYNEPVSDSGLDMTADS